MNATAVFLFFEELPVRKAFKRSPMDLLVFSRLHTEVMSLRLNTNSQTYSSLVISDTHRHISSKPREFYIPTKYLVFQTPA